MRDFAPLLLLSVATLVGDTANSADIADQDAAVLSAVAEKYCSDTDSPYVVLESIAARPPDYLDDWLQAIHVQKEDALSLKNRNPSGTGLPPDAEYKCLRVTESAIIDRAFKTKPKHFKKEPERTPEWAAFYEAFPKAKGVMTLSLPAYLATGNEAIVYVSLECGSLCGTGYIYSLLHASGTWTVTKKTMLWIS